MRLFVSRQAPADRYDDVMRAFKVQLNGKRLCVAGIGEDGVLSAIIDHVVGKGRNELHFRVGGLRVLNGIYEHVEWRTKRLRVGDRLSITVVETESVDPSRVTLRTDDKWEERNAKAYVRSVAKKYGWKLVTRPRKGK